MKINEYSSEKLLTELSIRMMSHLKKIKSLKNKI